MDDKQKKELLKMVPYGLYVITAISKDRKTKNGFSGSWLSQVSFKPPLIMIGSQKDSLSTKLILESEKFVINFVDETQSDIVKHFFKSAHTTGDKLSEHEWKVGEKTGCPILKDGLGYFECEVREKSIPGDHAIIIGEIVNVQQLRQGPALHMRHTPWNYSG
ncbi:MAG: flavin reductase family protein [Candidatus Hodarchaeales archaeon]|jgi:flavin reductase (DIM6/NTAB) family NADH-FMN oxidoreductase RutF